MNKSGQLERIPELTAEQAKELLIAPWKMRPVSKPPSSPKKSENEAKEEADRNPKNPGHAIQRYAVIMCRADGFGGAASER